MNENVSVHDGFPNAATDTSLQSLDLNTLLIRNSVSTYFIRLSGDDWQKLGIFHGDIAINDRALTIKSGDIVAWHQDSELAISYRAEIPKNATTWGVIAAIIHQYRTKP